MNNQLLSLNPAPQNHQQNNKMEQEINTHKHKMKEEKIHNQQVEVEEYHQN